MTEAELAAPGGAAPGAAALADARSLVGDDAAAAVVSLYQKQKTIYARSVSGLFATWRWFQTSQGVP